MAETVLMYNWVRPDRANLAGGGVSVYIQGLLEIYKKRNATVDFLASGENYHYRIRKPFLSEDLPAPEGCRNCWELVNSIVKAPAHDMFGDPILAAKGDNETNEILRDFFKTHKYTHVIINNVEGIPTQLFKIIKEEQPGCKVVVVAHNYHLICPQIELLYRGEFLCHDYNDGKNCLSCLGYQPVRAEQLKLARIRDYKERYSPWHNVIGKAALLGTSFKSVSRYPNRKDPKAPITNTIEEQINSDSEQVKWWGGMAPLYKEWREGNVGLLNKYVDKVICVSNIVKSQLVKVGVNPDKVSTIHLSMPCVKERTPPRDFLPEGPITVSYFGYDIPSKGLDIFLETLDMIPEELAKDFNILVVSGIGDYNKRLLSTFTHKFNSVELLLKYDRSQLKDLLKRIDVNVAISRWWETYHQVTYEMINYGVPAFVASNMGISELYSNDSFFKLKEPDPVELLNKLVELNENREYLLEYYDNPISLPTPEEYENKFIKITS